MQLQHTCSLLAKKRITELATKIHAWKRHNGPQCTTALFHLMKQKKTDAWKTTRRLSMHTATRYSLESSEVVMMGRQSGSWTATSYEGLPRDDLVAKIKPDTLDNSYCRSIYTPQRTYWIMFDSSAKNAMRKK